MEKQLAKVERMAEAETPTELVAQGVSIVKLENQTQMQIAVQHPRDEEKILSEALHELDLYPSMAREAIYMKPVGKDDSGQAKTAEGLSIRAAESLGNRWANSSYGVEIVSEDADTITLAAVFLDYELNTRHVRVQRVSKFYKTKSGQVVRWAPDRLDTIVGAWSSKALREIILRSLPAGLKKEYETKARNILKREPLAAQRTSILERFLDLGVTQEQLESWRKKPMKEWKKEDVLDALGLVNAIRDGEVQKDDIFPPKPKNGQEAPLPGLVPK